MVKFKLTGHRELVAKLRTMDRKMRRSIGTKAVRAGARVTARAIKAAAPVDTGAGRQAIGTKVKQYRQAMVVVAITGERKGKRRPSKKLPKASYGAPHLHLIEFGTGERFHTGERKRVEGSAFVTHGRGTLRDVQSRIKKEQRLGRSAKAVAADLRRGKRTGRVTPRPFFRRAWQGSMRAMQSAQVAVLRREIEAAARGVA